MATSTRVRPPFRADHVGSLLRPARLAEDRKQWRAGDLSAAQLKAIEDDCIREAVSRQEAVGLQSITDGDFRRDDWFLDFMFAFDGMGRGLEHFPVAFSAGAVFHAPRARVVGRLTCPASGIAVDGFRFLKSVARRTAKLCIPAPAMFYTVVDDPSLDPHVYPDPGEFWKDLGGAYRAAIAHYGRAGCDYLQMDDCNSALIADPRWQEFWRGRGHDPEQQVDKFIDANNAALAGRPCDMTVVMHMCRGNFQSQWTGSGSYDMVAERYFSRSHVDGFFLEYDDERSGDFAPLRFMPKDKLVVLGLMTSKRPELESKDQIKRRLEEAAKYVPLERLCISPQCGFASTQEGNRLTPDQQWRKLSHLVEIADDVWGSPQRSQAD